MGCVCVYCLGQKDHLFLLKSDLSAGLFALVEVFLAVWSFGPGQRASCAGNRGEERSGSPLRKSAGALRSTLSLLLLLLVFFSLCVVGFFKFGV